MTPEEFEREQRRSGEALGRVVEGSHQSGPAVRTAESVLGPLDPTRDQGGHPTPGTSESPAWNPPSPPDLGPVNDSWQATSKGASASLLSRASGRAGGSEAQARFNSDQVQLDNALVTWTAEHFAATHRHYDAALARMQNRMDEIDTRHRELERELVRHVHEMARRIDVVLGEGEKSRVSHESALRSIRERLRALEEKFR